MKKLFIFTFVLSLLSLISCSKGEERQEEVKDPYIKFGGFHVKDTTGLRFLNSIQTEKTTYLLGLRNKKLWIGKFDKYGKEQLHEWNDDEDFLPEIKLGYGEITVLNLQTALFAILSEEEEHFAIIAEPNFYNNKIKGLYIADHKEIQSYHYNGWAIKWLDCYLIYSLRSSLPDSFYKMLSKKGEPLFERKEFINPDEHTPISIEESIYHPSSKDLYRLNLKTGETIWETHILLDNIPNDAELSSKITSKENSFWTYSVNITYYSGEKETRQFKINIDNGEIEYL